MDRLTKERRSWLMSRVGGKDTAPEMIVRKLLHGLGYRYRLHVAGMPGKPDMVLPSRRKVVFVHGCFWHAHSCRLGKTPKTNVDFWQGKAATNAARDAKNSRLLAADGWRVLVVWQCEIKNIAKLERRLIRFLGATSRLDQQVRTNRV